MFTAAFKLAVFNTCGVVDRHCRRQHVAEVGRGEGGDDRSVVAGLQRAADVAIVPIAMRPDMEGVGIPKVGGEVAGSVGGDMNG